MADARRRKPEPAVLDGVLERLSAILGPRLQTGEAVRGQHANMATSVNRQPPDAVAFPQTTDEVVAIVRLCAAAGVPVIPYGTGTSFEGHVNAPFGGVSVDCSQMNRLLAVHAEDLDCVVEPGLTRKALNAQLRDTGLFFPIDPGADASIGGMIGTRASGTNAVRYGTMKDNVVALTVVTPDGAVVETARRALKSAAGYDLTRLFVGAEGTLGIVTAATLRLHGIPEAISGGVCPFPSVEAACLATIATVQSGIPVARIELLDALQVRACNLYSGIGLPETPCLFVEFHGSAAGVIEQSERFGAIAADLEGGPFHWATVAEERTRLWQARHDVYWAGFKLRPGAKTIPTDVCVPISRLAECVVATQADIAASDLVGPIVGHVGDGNFHVGLLVDEDDPAEMARVHGFMERLVHRALALEGTCTGEHGVGQGKAKYLRAEYPAATLDLMARIKRAIDPLDIMNPGKILPLDG
ncbi:FAD-linked oxidase C-terminal domain-containing protein [Lichenihabitans sp. Uapishka_5]|uniref:FAD-binding oxidoreductase n=1 Tax=Lichenihabitans sp. Uapishka_5 TaxID=3037302 RepID=UPI0029E82624|nr:FAD-linked oxidase C-terminal domain-containing protein [Lichenihabitans sp. Uapishka_5]MDX7951653.1 FAD-linked oxidase C-terminal domain-containing protein [Lichenihabitans sp. Uapishka_5]